MVKLKVGKNILDINDYDLILDNGMCYMIITKEVGYGINSHVPVMSKKLVNDLKKHELIFTNEALKQAAIKRYGSTIMTYWKFNIKRMKEYYYDDE